MTDFSPATAPEPALTLSRAADGLVLCGELDLGTAPLLRVALDESRTTSGCRVVLDMAGLTFMDSSGLRELVGFHRDGGEISVRNPSPAVMRILELTQTLTVFNVESA